ncbi:hypothetical protein NIES2101_24380 [Calothrix sp. HK-06]|nr:hypothetical protein NIES2101_24380 [Calothrix sp. HK-06]
MEIIPAYGGKPLIALGSPTNIFVEMPLNLNIKSTAIKNSVVGKTTFNMTDNKFLNSRKLFEFDLIFILSLFPNGKFIHLRTFRIPCEKFSDE